MSNSIPKNNLSYTSFKYLPRNNSSAVSTLITKDHHVNTDLKLYYEKIISELTQKNKDLSAEKIQMMKGQREKSFNNDAKNAKTFQSLNNPNNTDEKLVKAVSEVKKMRLEIEELKKTILTKDTELTNIGNQKLEMSNIIKCNEKRINDLAKEVLQFRDFENNFSLRKEDSEQKQKLKNEFTHDYNKVELVQICENKVVEKQKEISESKLRINNLQVECDNLKKILTVKNELLSNCKDEIINLKESFKQEKSEIGLKTHDTPMFSSIPTYNYESLPDSRLNNLKRENEELKITLKKKQNAINVMKEKIKTPKCEVDVKTILLQNKSYLTQLKEAEIEKDKLKDSNKDLHNKAESLKKDKLILQAEMDNLKMLNFKIDTASLPALTSSQNVQSSKEFEKFPSWWQSHASKVV